MFYRLLNLCFHSPPDFPPHPLSVRQVSNVPFILSCDSAHLPPYTVQWWTEPVTLPSSPSSHLTHRHTSSYSNTLTVAPGSSLVGTTFTCGVGMQVQQTETPRNIVSHKSKCMFFSFHSFRNFHDKFFPEKKLITFRMT